MISIYKENEDNLLVVLNLKEANLGNADEFKAAVIQLFDKYQKTIVINMELVQYIDSSFLGALVALLKHALALKLDLILVGLHKNIAELFTLIRLDKVFKIHDDFNAYLNS